MAACLAEGAWSRSAIHARHHPRCTPPRCTTTRAQTQPAPRRRPKAPSSPPPLWPDSRHARRSVALRFAEIQIAGPAHPGLSFPGCGRAAGRRRRRLRGPSARHELSASRAAAWTSTAEAGPRVAGGWTADRVAANGAATVVGGVRHTVAIEVGILANAAVSFVRELERLLGGSGALFNVDDSSWINAISVDS